MLSHSRYFCPFSSSGNGRLGDGTTTQRTTPTPVSGGGTWKLVVAGSSHSCGIKTDDSLHCWGNNANGRLGDGTTTQRTTPTPVSGGGTWKLISAGGGLSCGIKVDDSMHCWGDNSSGQVGDNSTTQRLIPTAISGGGTWKSVAAGANYSCGINAADSSIYCWGSNNFGQLTATEFSAPYRMTGVQPICGEPAGKAGDFVFNNIAGVMEYCDGAGWIKVGM